MNAVHPTWRPTNPGDTPFMSWATDHRTHHVFRPHPRRLGRITTALALLLACGAAPITGADVDQARIQAEDPDAPAEGPVNVLEAIEVSTFADNLPWAYAETGGTEIISMCSDAATRAFMHILRSRQALMNDTLPAHLRGEIAVPSIVVLFDADDTEALRLGQLRRQYMLTETGAELSRRKPPPTPQTSWAEDRDIAGFSANLRYGPPHDETLRRRWPYSVTTAMRFVLSRQYPQPPPWLLEGLEGHFRECTWLEKDRAFALAPVAWVSPRATRNVLKNPREYVKFLPLLDLFRTGPDDHVREPDDTYSLYEVQAALFVRWALESNWRERRDAFWQFVTRVADEPVTEELFFEHFGMSSYTAEAALRNYLPAALQTEVTIQLSRRAIAGRAPLRSATEDEIGRIKADWERLQIRSSGQRKDSAIVTAAFDSARRVSRRGYELGRADPRILAVRGLIEVDAGDPAAAKPYLEEAVRNDVARPAAYVELARIRLNHALEHPGGRFGSISSGQLNSVMEILDAARTQVPLMPEVYSLMAEASASSSALPEPKHLRMMAEGARLFPRHSDLVCRVAELHAANGLRNDALAMVDHCLSLSPDRVARDRLESLQGSLSDPIQFRLRTSSSEP